jgi:hypothetical protein
MKGLSGGSLSVPPDKAAPTLAELGIRKKRLAQALAVSLKPLRKNFTMTEAVAVKRALEPIERAEAKKRQLAGLKKGKARPVAGNSRNGKRAPTAADKVSKVVGKDRKTLAKAEAIVAAAEAEQANDITLIDDATDIRMRAEVKAGELFKEMAERKERAVRGGTGAHRGKQKSLRVTSVPKLAELGVTKSESSRWQRLASLPAGDCSRRWRSGGARRGQGRGP